MEPLTATEAPAEPIPLAEPAEELSPPKIEPYGIEFTTTAKGSHRAKIGPVERVMVDDGVTLPRVAAPVLHTDPHEDEDLLHAKLGGAIGAIAAGGLEVIGSHFTPPRVIGLVAPEDSIGLRITYETTPEHLIGFDSNPIDRRHLGILTALDRRFDHFIDTRARRIWLQLLEGKTLPEAIEHANKLSAGGKLAQLTQREGFELAQREAYRLALHVVLVQNRDAAPRAQRLG